MAVAKRMDSRRPERALKTHAKIAIGRAWNPLYHMNPREIKLVMSIVKREKIGRVRPGEFELDAGNAVNRFVVSELGLKSAEQRGRAVCLADGLTAAQIIIMQKIKTAGWQVGDRKLEGNVVKRLLEDATVAMESHGENWEARHAGAQLDRANQLGADKSMNIIVDTALFKSALKKTLGEKDYNYFISRRAELMRAAKRMWKKRGP